MEPETSDSHQKGHRTVGDGMDSNLLNLTETLLSHRNLTVNIRPSTETLASFKPVEPKTTVYYLIPKYVPKERKRPKYLVGRLKEPKFIPYEPYKGAIEPILPRKTEVKFKKRSKNNVEIHDLVFQMSEMRTAELNKVKKVSAETNEFISKKQWEVEKLAYEADIKNLRESNSHLENQLKFQAQVNSELKTLLVAAVGEDLESRVQHLTEDKLQLARALLSSANHLTSHQEQTEWLSGQCEVWRSKFLASSLMVEELARWKSALTSRVNDLQETVKALLEDRYRAQKKSLKTYCYLSGAIQKLCDNQPEQPLKSANIVELTEANCKLSQKLSDRTDINKDNCDALFQQCLKLPQNTVSEKHALKVLQNSVTISNKQDAICNALMGTAMSLSGQQMYLQHPSSHCCSHCTGEVKDV